MKTVIAVIVSLYLGGFVALLSHSTFVPNLSYRIAWSSAWPVAAVAPDTVKQVMLWSDLNGYTDFVSKDKK